MAVLFEEIVTPPLETFPSSDIVLCPCGNPPVDESLFCSKACALHDAKLSLSSPSSHYRTAHRRAAVRISSSSFESTSSNPFSVNGIIDHNSDDTESTCRSSRTFSWSSLIPRRSSSAVNILIPSHFARARKHHSGDSSTSAHCEHPATGTDVRPTSVRTLKHTKAYANVKRATTLFRTQRKGISPNSLPAHLQHAATDQEPPSPDAYTALRHVRRSVSVPRLVVDEDLNAIRNSVCEESVIIAGDLYQWYTYV